MNDTTTTKLRRTRSNPYHVRQASDGTWQVIRLQGEIEAEYTHLTELEATAAAVRMNTSAELLEESLDELEQAWRLRGFDTAEIESRIGPRIFRGTACVWEATRPEETVRPEETADGYRLRGGFSVWYPSERCDTLTDLAAAFDANQGHWHD